MASETGARLTRGPWAAHTGPLPRLTPVSGRGADLREENIRQMNRASGYDYIVVCTSNEGQERCVCGRNRRM